MRNRMVSAVCGFLVWSLVFVSAVLRQGSADAGQKRPALSRTAEEPLVILDAGHGGEDGGAVSADGVAEKTLNLSIVLRLGDMLTAAGIPVSYTRTEDCGLYAGAEPGHRKMADLRNRLEIFRRYPDAVCLSVHMNAFSDGRYHGMQVFYAGRDPRAEVLAEIIREKNRTFLQKDNTRKTKKATAAIYLLDRCDGTAVLAECGFLSNRAEAALLSDPEYQGKTAAVLCSAVLAFLCGQEKGMPGDASRNDGGSPPRKEG